MLSRHILRSARLYSTGAPAAAAGVAAFGAKGNLKEHILRQYDIAAEKLDVNLPSWQRAMGKNVISMFNLDMDRIRSGPVAGAHFKDICKNQAFFDNDTNFPLSDSAKFYYETLGLPKTFNQWYQITALHMWMLYVRMRAMPRQYCREYQQKLVNGVFEDIDFRLRETIKVKGDRTINNYKKSFNNALRGSVFAYDEGFFAGDTVLAGALWRNLWDSKENVDMAHIEQLIHYIRAQLYVFERMSDIDFAAGRVLFLDPRLRYEPLTQADEEEIRAHLAKMREKSDVHQKTVLSGDGW